MKSPIAAASFALFSTGALAQDIVPEALGRVAPALEAYTTGALHGRVWQDDTLPARDRALITFAAMMTRHETGLLPAHVELALEAGVTAAEISETITHLAFYAGWGNAVAAAGATASIFEARGIAVDDLPPVNPDLLPLNEEAEAMREQMVQGNFGAVSPGVVANTRDLLFRDLWLRPGLAPRDRSLVTVAALVAAGQPEQMSFHLSRAMDNGLTQAEAGEVLTHLAFYTGWPRVFSALPVAKQVFEQRAE